MEPEVPTFVSVRFPFPSNGKVLSDFTMNIYVVEYYEFPFPSNGKVLSDGYDVIAGEAHSLKVSIPFQRESPFGPHKTGYYG